MVNRALDEAARRLRRQSTPAERTIWQLLRGHRQEGLGFRRQHPIGPFIADFACPTRKLIVEIDGPVHEHQAEQEGVRAAHLAQWGWTVVRFTNEQVLNQTGAVLAEILRAAHSLPCVR